MIHSTDLRTKNKFDYTACIITGVILLALVICSFFIGKYPLTAQGIITGEGIQRKVFWTLRFSRTVMAVWGGFCLGITGFTYQTIFRNPLSSPDIICVSSGASAGAAAGILFFGSSLAITLSSFFGAFCAVIVALLLASLDNTGRNGSIVLSGIAVHALAQTVLMALKLTADPEKELASIEYWIMGGLNNISIYDMKIPAIFCIISMCILFLLHRQIILLSADSDEAKMLGVDVKKMQLTVLLISTLAVACTISLTGLISFIGLLAPHIARLITKNNRKTTMVLSGLMGSAILSLADILARSVASTELPISIFTSLIGAPFLIYLIIKRRYVL